MDTQDDGCIRNTPQSWTRGMLGPSPLARTPDPCADCGCDETRHEWPRDPSATPAEQAAHPGLRICLVATRWPPGTTRQECRRRGCACRRFAPRDTHRSQTRERKRAAVAAAADNHSGPLPAYARRRKPLAWEVVADPALPGAARDRTHVQAEVLA